MAVKILRLSDRLTIRVGEVEIELAPLTLFQRQEMLECVEKHDGVDVQNIRKATITAMKYSVKGIKGIETLDGEEYKLSFDAHGNLTDDCVTELLSTEVSDTMVLASYSMIYGMPTEIRDSEGKLVEGVEVVLKKKQDEKKSNN